MTQRAAIAHGGRAFYAIVAAAFVLRVAFVSGVHAVPVSDFAWYYDRAIGIAGGLGYTVGGEPTALWPPGWPYVLAAVVAVFGHSVYAATLLQAALNALTAGLVYLIARSVFGNAAALAAGWSYAVLPSAVEWCATLASEPLYTFLWVLCAYIWISRPLRSLGWYAVSGLLLGADALVRPSALLFWLPLAAFMLIDPEKRREPARACAAIATTVACMLLAVAPFMIRDYRVFGTFVLISNNGGVSLYEANNPTSGGGYTPLNDPRIARLMNSPRTEALGDRLASQLAIAYIEAHPLRELDLAIRKVKGLYESDDSVIRFTLRSRHFREAESPPPGDRPAVLLAAVDDAAYWTLMVFAAAGLLLCCIDAPLRRYGSTGWVLLLIFIAYNTATFALVGGIDRYRYPTMPFFSVFAGYGAAAALAYIRERLQSRRDPAQARLLPTGTRSAQR